MTAPAAALVSGAIAVPALRAAPQAVTDRFAFGAMLDSLPGATARAGSAVAEERSQTSNKTKQEQSPSGPSDSHSMLGDGAFLSSLPFASPSDLAVGQGTTAGVDAPPLASAATKGARLETSGASDAAAVNQAKPPVARLTGERAFHLASSTAGAVSASPSPAAGATVIDTPSFASALTVSENGNPALGSSVLAPLSTQDRRLTHAAPPLPSYTAAVSLSPDATPAVGAAPAMGQASAPVAPRGAGGSANPPVTPMRAAPQDLARGGRKVEAAASPSVARAASPAASSAKAEPVDKADARSARSSRPRRTAGDPREHVWSATFGVRRRAIIRTLRGFPGGRCSP